MKKRDLLKYIDDELLDKLFGFCYSRTNDSYEAEELCSDIIFALIKATHADGEIKNIYPFIWKIARNVYARFSDNRKKKREYIHERNFEDAMLEIAADETLDDDEERLVSVYRRIAFLTKAYRDVMVMYYIEGLSTREIAEKQGASEVAIRQRLFSARQKIKSEVDKMAETYNKPIALDKIDYVFCGTGSPAWGDPSGTCTKMLSKHIVWLCRNKPMSALEIAEKLNVPTLYIEEELEALVKGTNGEYGLLRRAEGGKYVINIVLFDKEMSKKTHALYTSQMPRICDIISEYLLKNRDEYLSFPYLNKRIEWNLILWQQIHTIASAFAGQVKEILKEKYFSDAEVRKRPYTSFAYVDNGKYYGCGCDGVHAKNLCGFSEVHLSNIYLSRVKAHFRCGHNISLDSKLQLTLRAIDGLDIEQLSDIEKEHAAKAIECGYLYREGNVLYTKILVSSMRDSDKLFAITDKLSEGFFDDEAEQVAADLAKFIKRELPPYLHPEWQYANMLANLPVYDALVENLIQKGILVPPEDGIGAEGCWMRVEK